MATKAQQAAAAAALIETLGADKVAELLASLQGDDSAEKAPSKATKGVGRTSTFSISNLMRFQGIKTAPKVGGTFAYKRAKGGSSTWKVIAVTGDTITAEKVK